MPRKLKEFTPDRGYTKEDWEEVSDPHEATEEQWRESKSFTEMFPGLAASVAETLKRTRGRQRAPIKALISLRLDQDVLTAYRATGAGWQARINDALRAALPKKALAKKTLAKKNPAPRALPAKSRLSKV